MKRRQFFALYCLTLSLAAVGRGESSGHTEQELDPDYERVLLANTFLMQAGGVDTLTLEDGTEVLIGVGQVVIKADATPADMLKAQRIAQQKATATVGQFLQTDVTTVSELIKKTTVDSREVNGQLESRARRVEKFVSEHISTRSQLKARVKPVGFWRSADGNLQFAAVAVAPLD